MKHHQTTAIYYSRMDCQQQRGFTMIELLVTLSIAAIMMTIAVPSFRDFLLNNRMTSQTNDFVLALASAKSEAVKRGVFVTVCSRATNATCAGSTTWDSGWLVFADNNGDGLVTAGTDVVLQVREALEGNNTLRAGARQRVTFQNTGFSSGFNDTFRLCDSRGTADGRSITVSMQGRVTSATGTTACP
jgi:type IV fimbrial biogenesis protein FimT